MRIVFAGTPSIAVPVLQALAASPHTVSLALTREDAPVGRSRVLTPSPVAQAASTLHIATVKANRLSDATIEKLADSRPDVGVVVAYGGLLPQQVLDIPVHGWLNIHFSLLPRWRGAAPVQHTLIAGETEAGVTIFRLDEGLDTGPIFAQKEAPISQGQSSGELLEDLVGLSIPMVLGVLDGLSSGIAVPAPQQGSVTHAPKLTREDAHLDFTRPVSEVLGRWAGVTPEPGAWANLGGRSVKFVKLAMAAESQADLKLSPGECGLHHGRAFVGTATAPLEVVTVQPEGKKPMSASDWLRGFTTLERFS